MSAAAPTGPAPGRQTTQRLRRLTEPELLEELVARYRAALVEEGVAAKVLRRGWVHVSLELIVQEWEVEVHKVGSFHSEKRPPVPGAVG